MEGDGWKVGRVSGGAGERGMLGEHGRIVRCLLGVSRYFWGWAGRREVRVGVLTGGGFRSE